MGEGGGGGGGWGRGSSKINDSIWSFFEFVRDSSYLQVSGKIR